MACELECFMNGQQYKKLSEKKFEPLMNKYNLRKIEVEILFFLSSYKCYDTAKDIVSLKFLSKAHVSKAIENLCRQHLLETYSDCNDRRCIHLAVSDKALPIIQEIYKVQDEIYRVVFDGITSAEQDLLLRVAKNIADNMNEELENE